MLRARLALMSLVVSAACRAPDPAIPQLGRAEVDRVTREVLARRAELLATIEARDVGVLRDFFSDAADAAFAGGGSYAPDSEGVLRRYGEVFDALRSIRIEIGPTTVAVISPRAAAMTTRGRVRVDSAGIRLTRFHAWTMLWVLEKDTWRLLQANQSYLGWTPEPIP
jgi:hypothetical protein